MEEKFVSPIYSVIKVPLSKIQTNDYNPNVMAPPELELLKKSILEDGYTMPVVCYYIKGTDRYEIVDGFHRYKIMQLCETIKEREDGYLPVVVINKPLSDRVASTIRHNRARGVHSIERMVDIVQRLVESGMSDAWINRNIGMDREELLRLKQISGLSSLFKEKEFSRAWEGRDEQ